MPRPEAFSRAGEITVAVTPLRSLVTVAVAFLMLALFTWPKAFNLRETFAILGMLVIGGPRTATGAVAGAFLVAFAFEGLRPGGVFPAREIDHRLVRRPGRTP